jgi:hypothetical protein
MGSFVGFVVVLAPLSSSDDVQTSARALEHRYHRASTLKAAFFERNRVILIFRVLVACVESTEA